MVATSSNQTMGLSDRSFLKSLKASIIKCLDGMVGDRLSELPDDQRKGEMFESVCRSVALLASCALEHMGEDVHVARCTRRLVASLLPAGEVEEDEDKEEDDAQDDAEREADIGDESDAEMNNEETNVAEDMDEDVAGEGSASEDGGPSDDADATTAINVGSFEEEEAGEGEEVEEAGDQDEVDEEACSEKDSPESDEAECISSEDSVEEISDDPKDPRPSQTLHPLSEAMVENDSPDPSQPALPMLPRQPCPAAAAAASFMLQCLVRHPVFQQTAASDSFSSFAAPLPPFAARLGTPLPSLLDLVELPPHPPAQDGNPVSPLPPSAKLSTSSSSIHGVPSLRLELLLLLESLIDMRRAFDASSDNDDAEAATPSVQWPWRTSEGAGGTDEEVSGLRALLRLLQCSYGASLSSEDRACLRVMLLLDVLLQGPPNGEGGFSGWLQ